MHKVYIEDENVFGDPKCEINFGALSICNIFQYFDSNIEFLSLAPHKVIDPQTF